jgi:Protein of unknown function (DUF3467)
MILGCEGAGLGRVLQSIGDSAITVGVTNEENNPQPDDKPVSENIQHQPVAARVPEKIAKGIFCTGQVILDSPKEFVVDFLQGLTRPFQVVSRVVMTPQTVAELADALTKNVEAYTRTFGPPPAIPGPPPKTRPTLQEIYENFRLPEDLLSGTYANSVMIGHSSSEFFMDFISGFYPTSAVAARIFMPIQQITRFQNALTSSLENHRQRFKKREE